MRGPEGARGRLPQQLLEELPARLDAARGTRDRVHSLLEAGLSVGRDDEMRRGGFPDGSMEPKAETAARFVERTGGPAAIGALDAAYEIVHGRPGTLIRPNPTGGRPATGVSRAGPRATDGRRQPPSAASGR